MGHLANARNVYIDQSYSVLYYVVMSFSTDDEFVSIGTCLGVDRMSLFKLLIASS